VKEVPHFEPVVKRKYPISYGTRVALAAMRDYPEGIPEASFLTQPFLSR